MSRDRRERGFTLAELVIAIVVLSIGVVGILGVFTQAIVASADPLIRQQNLALAEGMLEEVMGSRCVDGATSPSPNRDRWRYTLDYDGLDQSPPQTLAGEGLPGLEDYRVTVAVEHPVPLGPTGNGVPACRITVTSAHLSSSESITLIAHRAESGDD